MPLQIAPRVKVPIKSKTQRADGVAMLRPLIGPGVVWEGCPGGDTLKFGLRVGLLSIGLFKDVAVQQGVCINKTQGIHAGRVGTEFTERAAW